MKTVVIVLSMIVLFFLWRDIAPMSTLENPWIFVPALSSVGFFFFIVWCITDEVTS